MFVKMASKVISRGSVLIKLFGTAKPARSIVISTCCQCVHKLVHHSPQHHHLFRSRQLSPLVRYFTSDTAPSNPNQSQVDDEDQLDELYKRITIEVKGHDPEVIKSYGKFLNLTTKELGIRVESVEVPKKDIKRYTLLKSVHIYKKHRVQYETRTYFRIMKIMNVTGSTADTFLEYVQRNLPEGMAMKVTKERIEPLPEHLKPPQATADVGAS